MQQFWQLPGIIVEKHNESGEFFMKKAICIIIAAVLLSGCVYTEKSEFASPEQLKKFVEECPFEEITLPNGEKIPKTDAVAAKETRISKGLYFDIGVVRFAEPIFESSFDTPDLYERLMSDEGYYHIRSIENAEYITVRAGDVLENGLTVEKAQSSFKYFFDGTENVGDFSCEEISFSGQLEMEGIISEIKQDDVYDFQKKGDLMFYPDGGSGNVLLMYQTDEPLVETIIGDGDFALIYDGQPLFVGNIGDLGEFPEVSQDLSENGYTRVKLTAEGIVLKNNITNGGTANIVSITKIADV